MAEDYRKQQHHFYNNKVGTTTATKSTTTTTKQDVLPADQSSRRTTPTNSDRSPTRPSSSSSTGTTRTTVVARPAPVPPDANDLYFKPAAIITAATATAVGEKAGDLLSNHATDTAATGSGRSSFSSTISTTFSSNFYVPFQNATNNSNTEENASSVASSSPVIVTAQSKSSRQPNTAPELLFNNKSSRTANKNVPPHLILAINDSAIVDNDDDDDEISNDNNRPFRNPSIITDDGNAFLLQIVEDNDQQDTTLQSSSTRKSNAVEPATTTGTQTTDSNFDLAQLAALQQQLYVYQHTHTAAGIPTSASMPAHYPLAQSASLQPTTAVAAAFSAARTRLALQQQQQQAARAAQFAGSKFTRNAISIDVSSSGASANTPTNSKGLHSNTPFTILESPAEQQQQQTSQVLSPGGASKASKSPNLLSTHIEINEPTTATSTAVQQQPPSSSSTIGRIVGRTKRTHSVAVPSMQRHSGGGGSGGASASASKSSSRGNSLRPDEHVPLLFPSQHHHHHLNQHPHHNPQHRASSFGLGGGAGASYFSASNSSSTLARTTPIKITIGGGGGRQRGRDLLKRMESLGGQVLNNSNSSQQAVNATPRTSISGVSYGLTDSPNFYNKSAPGGGAVGGGSASGVGTPTGSATGSFISRGSRRRRNNTSNSNMLSTSGNNAGSLSGVALDRMSSFRRRPRWAEGIQSAMEGPMGIGSGPPSSFQQSQQHRQQSQSQSQHHSFDSAHVPHDLLAGPASTTTTNIAGQQLPYHSTNDSPNALRHSFKRNHPQQQQQQSLSRVGSIRRNDSAGGGGPMSPVVTANFEMMTSPASYDKFNAGGGGGGGGGGSYPNDSRDMEDMNADNDEMLMMTAAQRWSAIFYENLLMIMTVVSVIAGAGVGFLLRPSFTPANQHQREIMYVRFIGDIFLQLLKMLILPLIVSSLIAGLASLAPATSGKLGVRAILYYFTTTIIAVIIGIVLTTLIQPGSNAAPEQYKADKTKGKNITTVDTFLDLARGMAPPNLVQACLQQVRTDLQPTFVVGDTGQLVLAPKEKWKIRQEWTDGMNLLGLVVFSVAFGITISRLGERGKPLLDFFDSLNEAVMKLVTAVMWLSPLGIFFLVCGKILEVDDFGKMIESLALYTLTVLLGLFIHGAIVLPTIYFVLTRRNPWTFIAGIGQALLTAFGTSSSSATLPVTIACLENNNGIDPRVTRFVLPVGSTINMDGTALYEAVAALFIAQTQAIDLDMGKIIAVSITATAASIGAAGVPQAGLVTMVMVLEAVGLPSEYVSLILAVDWFLDRVRTTINVLGDALGSGIIHYSCQDFLHSMDAKNAGNRGGGKHIMESLDEEIEGGGGANALAADELTKVMNNSGKSSALGPMTPPDYGAIGHHHQPLEQRTSAYRQFTPVVVEEQQQQLGTLPNGKNRNPAATS